MTLPRSPGVVGRNATNFLVHQRPAAGVHRVAGLPALGLLDTALMRLRPLRNRTKATVLVLCLCIKVQC